MTASSTPSTSSAPVPATTEPAAEAWRLIAELFFARSGHAAEVAQSVGLTPGHMRALLAIEPHEPKPMGALADALHCDASNITWLVDRLEERGYVERRADPNDRRVRTIVLTEPGERVRAQLHARLFEPPPEFQHLSVSELDTLVQMLRRVAPA